METEGGTINVKQLKRVFFGALLLSILIASVTYYLYQNTEQQLTIEVVSKFDKLRPCADCKAVREYFVKTKEETLSVSKAFYEEVLIHHRYLVRLRGWKSHYTHRTIVSVLEEAEYQN